MRTGSDSIMATSGVYGAVVPSDTVDQEEMRALYVGTSGDIAVMGFGSNTVTTFLAVPVGVFDIRPRRIMAAGTTADDIVALR